MSIPSPSFINTVSVRDLSDDDICDSPFCSLMSELSTESIVDWVQCDTCAKWFHLLCVGLESVEGDWVCSDCMT